MLHIIIEYSRDIIDLDAKLLIQTAHQATADSGLFADEYEIKSRASAFDHYQVGLTREKFIHVIVRLLAGRTDVQKLELTQLILARLVELGLQVENISVETVDIYKASYSKVSGH